MFLHILERHLQREPRQTVSQGCLSSQQPREMEISSPSKAGPGRSAYSPVKKSRVPKVEVFSWKANPLPP